MSMNYKGSNKDTYSRVRKHSNYNEFTPPNLQEAYSKTLYVIMKCRTEEQLNNAERYLRNYERLMQNSHLYPTINRKYIARTVNSLLSLLKIKRKDFKDF